MASLAVGHLSGASAGDGGRWPPDPRCFWRAPGGAAQRARNAGKCAYSVPDYGPGERSRAPGASPVPLIGEPVWRCREEPPIGARNSSLYSGAAALLIRISSVWQT